ncbi:CoA transferase [Thermodesulfobacteriota bacterium]
MTPKALAGIKILEYADMVTGHYCSKLLADLGAEVIKLFKLNFLNKSLFF